MPRLIDADALKSYLYEQPRRYVKSEDGDWQNEGYTCDDVFFGIDKQPTVDHVKHGHWIIVDWRKSDGVYPNQGKKCSCCFKTYHTTQVPFDANYCPNCGSKMDEEDKKNEQN